MRSLPGFEELWGGDYSGSAMRDAVYGRALNQMQPQLEERRAQIAQSLVDRGIPVGSEAYNAELDRYDRARHGALENLALSSVAAGAAEQSRILGHMQGIRGQEFGEGLASAQFDAGEQARRFAEMMQSARFDQSEAARMFGQGMANRQFDQSEASRLFGQGLANRQFDQSEAARLFGQGMANRQFDQSEAARLFGQGLANRQFDQSEAARLFGQGMANRQFDQSEASRLFGQGLARDQFDASRVDANRNYGLQRDHMNFGQLAQIFGMMGGPVGIPTMPGLTQYSPMGVDYSGNAWNQYGGLLNNYAGRGADWGTALQMALAFGGGAFGGGGWGGGMRALGGG